MTRKQAKQPKAKAKRPQPRSRPGPGHSRLKPFAEQILAWRREGYTWAQVVTELQKKGCVTDEGAVCRFIKRYQVKPYGIGQAPPVHPQPVAYIDVAFPATSATTEFKQPEHPRSQSQIRDPWKPKTK